MSQDNNDNINIKPEPEVNSKPKATKPKAAAKPKATKPKAASKPKATKPKAAAKPKAATEKTIKSKSDYLSLRSQINKNDLLFEHKKHGDLKELIRAGENLKVLIVL